MVRKIRLAAAALAVVFLSVSATQAADPAVKCEAGKLKEAGKYGNCRLKAEAKGVQKGEAPDYTKCEQKFSTKWDALEAKAGPGICPSEGDEASMNARITKDTADIATLLAGGTLPDEQLPASGQTTAFGPGSDGDVQAGAPLAYVDNGDGTITDLNTELIWEKKDDSGGIHDKDNFYTWSTGGNNMDGTILTTFLNTLNDVAGGGANCFAGSCDWRIPNVKELQSIVDYGAANPSVDSAFHQSATCTGCTDVTLATCSCTASSVVSPHYWSSTTPTLVGSVAWAVLFGSGNVLDDSKGNGRHVRAVRGGF